MNYNWPLSVFIKKLLACDFPDATEEQLCLATRTIVDQGRYLIKFETPISYDEELADRIGAQVQQIMDGDY